MKTTSELHTRYEAGETDQPAPVTQQVAGVVLLDSMHPDQYIKIGSGPRL